MGGPNSDIVGRILPDDDSTRGFATFAKTREYNLAPTQARLGDRSLSEMRWKPTKNSGRDLCGKSPDVSATVGVLCERTEQLGNSQLSLYWPVFSLTHNWLDKL
jgi:hypothetical protein